ncbi:MAG: anthranilate phosphoribosyltransferase family protein [Phormidium tanganyikae FI6-MK23]|jgi:anthranilate phosphoribosyltransferase|nr:anthranilate phosphoribosyltransferase family protein [Phormidium tanganyikae FI6-MK23]
MSYEFRELLKKVGSGPHTSENLTREEAETATRLMLLQEATPAQIGAFMISHRIKRPTGEELAGMLDAYDALSEKLPAIASKIPVTVMCNPYDGRSRTAPLSPLVAIVLSAVGVPVVLHGGDRMPTKEGVPLIELWDGLGVDWKHLSIVQVHQVLESTGLGLVYLPTHFPLAQGLVPYRDQIGKRPPFSTLELMWNPYAGESHLVCGYVHPPTEGMLRDAFAMRGTTEFTSVKGLEGSCDLPRDRTAIIGIGTKEKFDRLTLVPRDYGFAAKELPLVPLDQFFIEMQTVLKGEPSELFQAVVWNSGFYLWRAGACSSLEAGFSQAKAILELGQAERKLQQIVSSIANLRSVASFG